MEHRSAAGDGSTVRSLEHELELVQGAIAMVASGGSPRVSIGGLAFGEELIEPARRMARGTGVRIVPLWTTDEHSVGLAVERLDG